MRKKECPRITSDPIKHGKFYKAYCPYCSGVIYTTEIKPLPQTVYCTFCHKESIMPLPPAEAALEELALYFTSENGVPVERATILAKDFWRITGMKPE